MIKRMWNDRMQKKISKKLKEYSWSKECEIIECNREYQRNSKNIYRKNCKTERIVKHYAVCCMAGRRATTKIKQKPLSVLCRSQVCKSQLYLTIAEREAIQSKCFSIFFSHQCILTYELTKKILFEFVVLTQATVTAKIDQNRVK